jgi:hypothetical protein
MSQLHLVKNSSYRQAKIKKKFLTEEVNTLKKKKKKLGNAGNGVVYQATKDGIDFANTILNKYFVVLSTYFICWRNLIL